MATPLRFGLLHWRYRRNPPTPHTGWPQEGNRVKGQAHPARSVEAVHYFSPHDSNPILSLTK
jgi:hypothetical protein